MPKREVLDSTDNMSITHLGDGMCRLQTGNVDLMLSYDATFDLAIRLSQFLKHVDEELDETPMGLSPSTRH